MYYLRRLISCFLTLASVCSLFAQTVEVPLHHWSYDFLDRLRTRGLVETGPWNTRPFTRKTLVQALLNAQRKHGHQLDTTEREALDFLLYEFREEIDRLESGNGVAGGIERQRQKQNKWFGWLPDPLYKNGRNFLSLRTPALTFYFDPIFYRDGHFNDTDTLDRQDRVLQTTNGFTFWGTLGRRVGYYLNSRDTKESGTRDYPTSSRIAWPRYGFARGYGTHVYHDETVAYLYLTLPYVDIELGKNFNRWGPGRTGALALNDYATS